MILAESYLCQYTTHTNFIFKGDTMSRFEMVVRKEIEKNVSEVSIIDTEEYNVELYYCYCETENLFFCKRDIEQVVRELNWQDARIKALLLENKDLRIRLGDE